MQIVQVRDAVKAEIVRKMQRVSDEVTGGRAGDFAEYRRYCGRLQGMRDAMDCVDLVFNKLFDEGD